MVGDLRVKQHSIFDSRNRSVDDNFSCYDSWIDGMSVSSSVFEVQNSERSPQIVPLAPFSKPAPSKWDDADKWIASPTSNQSKNRKPREHCGVGSLRNTTYGYGSRQTSTKVNAGVSVETMVSSEEPETKWMDSTHSSKKIGAHKLTGWESDAYLVPDSYNKSVADNCSDKITFNPSQHDSPLSIHCANSITSPFTTARSVSMRDMGTEMSPISSREPSRTGTPVRAMSPKSSPTSSQLLTPRRAALTLSQVISARNKVDLNRTELSEKEVQMKTRREIMLLGTQLGKINIAAWASKEEEDKDASTLLKNEESEQPAQSAIEKRAKAWEEEEKAKYISRFKNSEIKIQAWENLEKAKAEAEMRKIEAEVERMRSRAHNKLKEKLAAAREKAEKKLAAAESKMSRQVSKTAKQTEFFRKTGQTPSSFFCIRWSL
ncbi:Remorin like [Heracleum sosnowskyi]|uniref:Remorin like n=1 Tax=Heracleum sosnowskyi TaxID=360622 RepID=A0AAD8IQX8_9APIA|nr:Remorin like [Heracleum sosnowskyi]